MWVALEEVDLLSSLANSMLGLTLLPLSPLPLALRPPSLLRSSSLLHISVANCSEARKESDTSNAVPFPLSPMVKASSIGAVLRIVPTVTGR